MVGCISFRFRHDEGKGTGKGHFEDCSKNKASPGGLMTSSTHFFACSEKKLRDQVHLFPEKKSAIKGKVRNALEDKEATDGKITEE